MSERCDEIEKKFEDFKDLYVKNNKEFLLLSFTVGALRDAVKEHKIQSEKQYNELGKLIQPYADLSAAMRVIAWLSKLVLAFGIIGGGWIGIKKLLE